jgi:hypothetical protein
VIIFQVCQKRILYHLPAKTQHTEKLNPMTIILIRKRYELSLLLLIDDYTHKAMIYEHEHTELIQILSISPSHSVFSL